MSIPTISKSIPYFLLSPLFWKLSQPPSDQDQQNGKHTVDYHPSPPRLISRILPLVFLWTPKGFISRESFLNLFLNLHIPPWLRKFQIYSVKTTGKYISESKNWISLFLFMHPSKTLPQVFIIIPRAEENCSFLPDSVFWRYLLCRTRGEDYRIEKITKIN